MEAHTVNTHPLPESGSQPRREQDTAALVRAAAAGDETAWTTLVRRLSPSLRAAARGFRLDHADVEDVVQSTWLAAVEHIAEVRSPEALPAWLLVTARREALRKHQQFVREVVTDDPPAEAASNREAPHCVLVDREQRELVAAAVGRLPSRQRVLLDTMLSAPDASYDSLATSLDMPVGSIGPTRRRALERLQRDRGLAALVQA
jgi:RNA polymerase sigma factor (sigma-70 family)